VLTHICMNTYTHIYVTDIYNTESKFFNVMEGRSLRPRISMIITCIKRFPVDKAIGA